MIILPPLGGGSFFVSHEYLQKKLIATPNSLIFTRNECEKIIII